MATAMTDTMETIPAVQVIRHFSASREAVFAALTKPEALMQWFGPDGADAQVADVDLRPGGRYRFEIRGSEGGIHSVGGEYIDIDPPDRLVFTWMWEQAENDNGGQDSLVTIELAARAGGTELTLTHEKIRDAELRERHSGGWNSSFDCLERYLAAA